MRNRKESNKESTRKVYKSVYLLIMGFLFMACGGEQPDLVSTIEVMGAAVVNAENQSEVPIRVVVKNEGNAPAGIFKVSVDYTDGAIDPSSSFVVAFTVPGQEVWYPKSSANLAAGAEFTFNGKLTFHSSEHGVTVSLKALADSCSGEEFTETECRVAESNEGNNESTAVTVALL